MAKLNDFPKMVLVAVFVFFCIVEVSAEVQLGKGTKILNRDDIVQYKDCNGLLKAGYRQSGVHVLYRNKTSPFLIHCEFRNNTAFNLIQRRLSNDVNFDAEFNDYAIGFGNFGTGSYWAGLDNINHLTVAANNRVLTITMQDWRGNNVNVRYTYFQVQPRQAQYQMTVSGFSSSPPTAGDDLSHNSGMRFYTKDVPDPNKCALKMGCGWWFNYCTYTLPNGFYYPPGPYKPVSFYDGIYWSSLTKFDFSLKYISMTVSNV